MHAPLAPYKKNMLYHCAGCWQLLDGLDYKTQHSETVHLRGFVPISVCSTVPVGPPCSQCWSGVCQQVKVNRGAVPAQMLLEYCAYM